MTDVPAPETLERENDEADRLEAESIKYNVARIVRLSSGRFALLSHYQGGMLNLLKIGTLEEVATFIPTADECADLCKRVEEPKGKLTKLDLADLGL